MMTDEEFREQYKPLQVPAHYDPADTEENKIIYALAQIGEGSVTDVIAELNKLEPGILNAQLIAFTKSVVVNLFDKGRLSGEERKGLMRYNLHKITRANGGATEPGQH